MLRPNDENPGARHGHPSGRNKLNPPQRQRSSRAELQDLPGGTSTPGDVWCLRSTATLGDTRNGATHKERGPDCCGETCARSWRASNDRDGRLAVSHPRAATKWYRRTPAHLAIQGVAAARPSRRARYRPHHGGPTPQTSSQSSSRNWRMPTTSQRCTSTISGRSERNLNSFGNSASCSHCTCSALR